MLENAKNKENTFHNIGDLMKKYGVVQNGIDKSLEQGKQQFLKELDLNVGQKGKEAMENIKDKENYSNETQEPSPSSKRQSTNLSQHTEDLKTKDTLEQSQNIKDTRKQNMIEKTILTESFDMTSILSNKQKLPKITEVTEVSADKHVNKPYNKELLQTILQKKQLLKKRNESVKKKRKPKKKMTGKQRQRLQRKAYQDTKIRDQRKNVARNQRSKNTNQESQMIKMLLESTQEVPQQMRKRKYSVELQQKFMKKVHQFDKNKKIKTNQIKQVLTQEQNRSCSFHPKTNIRRGERKRSIDLFLKDQQKFQERKNEKSQNLRQKINRSQEKSLRDIPRICKNSDRLFRSNQVSVYKRLYQSYEMKSVPKKKTKNLSRKRQLSEATFRRLPFREAVHINQIIKQSTENITMQPKFKNPFTKSFSREKKNEEIFHPEIQKKSKRLKRDRSVGEILYQDAERRIQKKSFIAKQMKKKLNNVKKVSMFTEEVLAKKFMADYNQIFKELQLPDWISFYDMCRVIQALNFFRDITRLDEETFLQERYLLIDLWLALHGNQNETIPKRNFLVFLFAIMDLKISIERINLSIPQVFQDTSLTKEKQFIENIFKSSFKQNLELYENYETIGRFDERGNLILKISEAKFIHSKFEVLYFTRMNIRKQKRTEEKYSFQPKINSHKWKLAQKHREKMFKSSEDVIKKSLQLNLAQTGNAVELTHADLLIFHNKAMKAKNQLKRQYNAQEEVDNCAFRPNLRQSEFNDSSEQSSLQGKHRAFELYSLAKSRLGRVDRDPEDIDYQKQCDECTFAPDLTSTRNRSEYQSIEVNGGLPEAIQRMKDGNELRKNLFTWKNRGIVNAKALKKIKKSQRVKKHKVKLVSPQKVEQEEELPMQLMDSYSPSLDFSINNQLTSEKKQRTPLLFVDVNLGNGNQERIVVCEGDNVNTLAEDFSQYHGLNPKMKTRLIQMLESQMQNMLAKIDEEEIGSEESDM